METEYPEETNHVMISSNLDVNITDTDEIEASFNDSLVRSGLDDFPAMINGVMESKQVEVKR